MAYSHVPSVHWPPFASLILQAAYEATMWAAVLTTQRGTPNVVLLPRLGGGAFGNEDDWIHAAMRRAMQKVVGFDLDDVRLVSYGSPAAHAKQPSPSANCRTSCVACWARTRVKPRGDCAKIASPVDAFAGPGGLGEGFSAHRDPSGARSFRLVVSVEKDAISCRTLRLRAIRRRLEDMRRMQPYFDFVPRAVWTGMGSSRITGASDIEPLSTRYYGCSVVGLYNPTRRYSTLGYISPVQFEQMQLA